VFHKLFSTGLGIGYIGKGAGTVAALACCICWYLLQPNGYQYIPALSITMVLTLVGVWSSGKVENIWGPDPQRVVIDEIAGMCISLLFLPVSVKYVLTGLILFRFFDIVKPLGIKKMENLPGGWGIMFDDVLAGVYSNLILQMIFYFKLY
jgi:phosphatidylglycerophosphatase A